MSALNQGDAVDVEQHFAVSEEKKTNEAKEDVAYTEQLEMKSRNVESAAIDEVYGRKVYIFNKIMNEHIGMTWWQWGLLGVSGVGWLIDNAWLQLIAIILPQVQVEFGIQHPEFMTIALYAGLICGAAFWGTAADIVGRRLSFNATLFIAGVFGIASGGATSFVGLGGLLAALGFGLGGSLPVDGMLFLEFLPGNRQYLLTLLSVFWSLGQLMSSLIGWGLIVNYNCQTDGTGAPCSAKNSQGWIANNAGWRYLNFTIGAFTLACFFLRFVVFKIPESPKFLLSKGRDEEAIEAMKNFAKMCGKPIPDDMLTVGILRSAAGQDGAMDDTSIEELVHEQPKGIVGRCMHQIRMLAFNARSVRFTKTLTHIKPLFSNFALGYTTAVIWILWALIGLAYPLFNSFIILYLQAANGDGVSIYNSLAQTYTNYAYISLCGVPGSLIATWMVTFPRSGRRGAMSIGTLLSGVFLFGFTAVGTSDGTLAFSCVTAFTQNIMYGVLYCYTPESFPAPLRGTADGIASSLNRLTGLFAPIIKIYGVPQKPNPTQAATPVYVAGALYLFSGLLMLTLRVETSSRTAL